MSTSYYESAAELELVLADRESMRTIVNIIVNSHEHEVLLSDYVSSIHRNSTTRS